MKYFECLPYDTKYGPHCYRIGGEIYYSPNGASEQSGYSVQYIQYLCKEGKIDCIRDFIWWYIPLKQVKELKERKNNGKH